MQGNSPRFLSVSPFAFFPASYLQGLQNSIPTTNLHHAYATRNDRQHAVTAGNCWQCSCVHTHHRRRIYAMRWNSSACHHLKCCGRQPKQPSSLCHRFFAHNNRLHEACSRDGHRLLSTVDESNLIFQDAGSLKMANAHHYRFWNDTTSSERCEGCVTYSLIVKIPYRSEADRSCSGHSPLPARSTRPRHLQVELSIARDDQ